MSDLEPLKYPTLNQTRIWVSFSVFSTKFIQEQFVSSLCRVYCTIKLYKIAKFYHSVACSIEVSHVKGKVACILKNTLIFIRFYFIHFPRLNSISIILFWENTASASKNYQLFEISNHSWEH